MTYSSSWERFVETGAISGVRLPVAASWRRSVSNAPGAERFGIHEEFEPNDVLARAARSVLRGSEDALANTTTWVALADARGVVTYEWSSTSNLRHRLNDAAVSAGAVLDERIAGTNGVGLALATRSPSIVSGGEHFNPAWSDLVCVAAPLLHPITREVLGVANITSLVEEENNHLKITLNSMVAGIRESLAAGLRTRHQRLLDAHLRVCATTQLSVVTLDAHTMIVEDPREQVSFDRAELWSLIERAGISATRLSLPSGQAVRLVPVDSSDITAGCSLVFGTLVDARRESGSLAPLAANVLGPIEQAEHDVIVSVLRDVEGNKSLAAERLRISRGTLYERIRRYHIDNA